VLARVLPLCQLGRGRYTPRMTAARLLALVLACSLPAVALAQWQWLDKDGRKVFSDQAPPADVPANRILKRPGQRNASAPEEAAAPVKTAAPAAPKVTGKDKELEEKKKRVEAEEAEKKKGQEQEVAAAKAENCARSKRAKATFDSGARVSTTNDKGERVFMEDKDRAAEVKRLDTLIARDCAGT
jgi:type IV secretory pathway VirB10-like protein